MSSLHENPSPDKTPTHDRPRWTRGVVCEVGPNGLIAPTARAGASTCLLVPLSELRKTWRRYYPITLDGRQSSTRRYFWTIDLQRYGVPLFYGGQMFIGISGTLLRRFARPIDWAAFRQRLAEGS